MSEASSVRERVQAANRSIRSLKRIDRAAAAIITLGGLAIVASVLGILIFIMAEVWPLFRSPTGRLAATITPAAVPASLPTPVPASTPAGATLSTAPRPTATPAPAPVVAASPAKPLAMGVDEYQLYAYVLRTDGRVEFFRLADGAWARGFAVPGLEGRTVTAGSRAGDRLAAGTADGRVALAQVLFQPRYEAQRLVDLDIELVDGGVVDVQTGGRPVLQVSASSSDSGGQMVAALVGPDEIALWTRDEAGEERRQVLRAPEGEAITQLRLGGGDRLVAGTERGNVLHWTLEDEPRLDSVSPTGSAPVTALEWGLGEVSFVAGNAKGEVSAWFTARLQEDDAEAAMVRAHDFAPQASAVTAIGAGSRDKSFATAGEDGSIAVRYLTSERTLLTFPGNGKFPTSVLLTPKNDGLLVARADGALDRYEISVPHPEVTWDALFGKLWYEGYGRPEYVWQSTGATNDFETKLSLIPLIFGTLKGTLYALLFAVPLAVMGALYTSQFMHPDLRGRVKPTVEIMAALPSVVIGFIAGLWLAPLVERVLVPVLLMGVLLPVFGTAGIFLWRLLPSRALRRLKPGMELALIIPLVLLGGWVAVGIGPWVEAAFFQGDLKLWLSRVAGITYDQRNSLVVGLAMGFAVIPIIFTIADDALSSVPSNLTAGSLALGASRWQTALRVVLPTASPGIFSAVMVGFGRAVGETMIVLMATGNTPVLDWSIFNGMRTLSANIAVEIPEAPYGGTLYRVLFLAAALLFLMTFIVNTVAELIRQRLRERYRTL